ncbi:hypothetical protein GN244_ATG10283 [Phytophthora infestans]|uniref:Uncharacterized protein n=1 Tax=Phytophthora infestans TaxID=4787 RepID=A0A833W0Z2_PHYIN|nr:hypothetical protein GN244_ATG10283 [Phytophthora infestans]KAF4139758.1 hypothetical protein GN958_ATG10999 [Phytophthora infestans]KAI9988006.1 hypothetical protein PInf_024266 [Phytophthora infestans]
MHTCRRYTEWQQLVCILTGNVAVDATKRFKLKVHGSTQGRFWDGGHVDIRDGNTVLRVVKSMLLCLQSRDSGVEDW